MTRRLSRDLAELEKLTRAREQAALAMLARVAAKKQAAAQRVIELMTQEYQATTVDELVQLSRWYAWRNQELSKRNTQLAAIEAEYRQAVKECGRFVAEQAVVEELAQKARKDEAALRQKRQALTSPDARCR